MSAERFHSTSTIALMTPVSALVYEGKWSINSANGARCEHTGALTRSARPMRIHRSVDTLRSPGANTPER